MSEAVNAPPGSIHENPETVQRVMSTGRATGSVWLGLCYAPCIVAFGLVPSIDAAVLLYLSQDMLKKVLPERLWNLKDEMLSNIPLPALYVYSGTRLALKAPDFASGSLVRSVDFLVVSVLVVLIKLFLLESMRIGIRVGSKIMMQSMARVISPNANLLPHLLRADYHGAGVTVFGVVCLLLGAIATT